MRIVFLSPSGSLGGAERVLIDAVCTLRPLLASEDELHVVQMSEGRLGEKLREAGAVVHLLPMPSALATLGETASMSGRVRRFAGMLKTAWRVSAYARRLRTLLRRLRPDVIHSIGMKSHLLSGWMQRRGNHAKLVWHVHDFIGARPRTLNQLRRFANRVSTVIAISPAVARDCERSLPGTAVRVVLNGIDVDHFSPTVIERDEGASVRVGLIATYARWKGQDLFIDAAAIAKNRWSVPLKFRIVGGPIYETRGSQFSREELEVRARSVGLTNVDLEFVEFVEDPVSIYRELDVVVHASTKPEPFGRTIAEAMACGRATIVSRAGGAAELFTEGIDAIGTTLRDPQALADAILALVADPARRDAIGSAARVTAVERFDRRRMGRELLDVYRAVLDSNPSGR